MPGPICQRIVLTSKGGLSGGETHEDLGGLSFRVLFYVRFVTKKKSLCVAEIKENSNNLRWHCNNKK